jgi:S-adenosyl-L-methionine hydrolase (adenosine-forming)
MARPVTFLSDYGTSDEFAGVVRAVIHRITPTAVVIDLGHGVPRQDVAAGARVLARVLPYTAPGVHLAVVDPEVGARRRAVALRVEEDDRLLVGPDNGLLLPAAERFGGVAEAVDVSASPWRLQPVSATFHGRDVFAPVAARLAAGDALGDAGTPLDPDDLVRVELSRARVEEGALIARVIDIDVYGNLALDADHRDVKRAELKIGGRVAVRFGTRKAPGVLARTFADVQAGALLVYQDAGGSLAVAVNGGDARALFGARRGDELRLEPG